MEFKFPTQSNRELNRANREGKFRIREWRAGNQRTYPGMNRHRLSITLPLLAGLSAWGGTCSHSSAASNQIRPHGPILIISVDRLAIFRLSEDFRPKNCGEDMKFDECRRKNRARMSRGRRWGHRSGGKTRDVTSEGDARMSAEVYQINLERVWRDAARSSRLSAGR